MARPPRPETEKPVSVSLRIPRDLYDEVQARARVRQTTLTALVLEGLQLCLDLPLDPREVPVSHSKTAMQELEALIDARVYAILATEQQRTAGDAPAQPIPAFLHDERIAVIQGQQEPSRTQDSNAVMQEPQDARQAQDSNAVMQVQAPYAAEKYYLGKLCPRAHAYEGTGQSLRYRGSKRCIACDTEDAQARRAARKRTTPQ
jgi:hypothetical protein